MDATRTHDITTLLQRLGNGDTHARFRLFDLLYDELHLLASAAMRGERPDHTLQPTALLNEACLKLLDANDQNFENRRHFFGTAAEVMRRTLIDHARAHNAEKRGGRRNRMPLDLHDPTAHERLSDYPSPEPPGRDLDQVLAIDHHLQTLETDNGRQATVVKLHFFAGLTLAETAAVLGVSHVTVKRDWRFARAWLASRLDMTE